MSDSQDRIAVPTNGHRPPLLAANPAADPADPTEPAPTAGPPTDDPRIAFSPGQVAAGFGILAALILLIAGRRRGKRG